MLPPLSLVALIENKQYGVEYQPIIDLSTQEIYAYECLARFYCQNESIPPDIVFKSLHKCPLSLFQVEYELKKLQLLHAPDNKKLFLNLDQDSFYACGVEGENNPFLELFNASSKKDIVIELIENSELNDARMSLAMIDLLSKSKIQTAIDDVFNPQSLISTAVIHLVDFIKLDRHILIKKHDQKFFYLVKSIVDYAHCTGKKIVLEGIEKSGDLLFAKQLNVDYVQGYWYRDSFIKKMYTGRYDKAAVRLINSS